MTKHVVQQNGFGIKTKLQVWKTEMQKPEGGDLNLNYRGRGENESMDRGE